MTRVMPLVFCALTCAPLCVARAADEPPKKLTPEERKELVAKWDELYAVGGKAYRAEKYLEAQKAFEGVVELARRLYPANEFPDGHADLAVSLNDLGFMYAERAKYAAAEPLYKEALEMRKRLFKGDHPDVAASMNNLAALYSEWGKPEAAEPLYKSALEMRKRVHKGDHPDVAQSLNNLAGLYHRRGKLADAEPLRKDALEMWKRMHKGDHPDVALGMNNLAGLYSDQGKLADAERLYKDALDMRKRLHKGDHPAIASGMNNLAQMYQDRGKLADAEPLLKSALEMWKRLFEGDHPQVAQSLNNLASLYRAQWKLADAEPLYKRALDMNKRLFPGNHPYVASGMSNLGLLYDTRGKYADAEPLLKGALEMNRRLHEGDHPAVAISLTNLSGLYSDQGRLADAEPLREAALDMWKRMHKGDHPHVAAGTSNLANLYQDRGKLADAEPLFKDALEMRKRMHKGDHPHVAAGLNDLAGLYRAQGRLTDAERLYNDALDMRKRLFKNDHMDVAAGMGNLAGLYRDQGKLADAEPLFKDALDMLNRIFTGDHPEVAAGMNNLAALYNAQGKHAAAERLYADALDMWKRMHQGDHPDVALGLNNLAALYSEQGKHAAAEPLYKNALDMRKRLHKGDHPDVASGLNNLAGLYQDRRKYADAEPLYKEALEMRKRLFTGDHPTVAQSLNNLSTLYWAQGKPANAEPLIREAQRMWSRLHAGDHPDVALGLNGLGRLYDTQGKYADAAPLLKGALEMSGRLTVTFARQKSEGEGLTLASSLPLYRDSYLSAARRLAAGPAVVYSTVWANKGSVARVYEQRQQQARSATDPALARMLADVAGARRRRAELLLAPTTTDTSTRKQRETDLKRLDVVIAGLEKTLFEKLPAVGRAARLASAQPAELQKVLPPDVAVVDFLRFVRFEQDKNKPGLPGESRTACYLAFVLTRDKVAWIELDTAAKIEPAVTAWREAITSGKEIPAATPAKVRELVWDAVRKELPAGIKTVYVSPDAALCRVPWGALPGDKPGTILLEDFAVATIPHTPFLLDKLWKQDPIKNPPQIALVVGGVKYDAPSAVGAVAVRSSNPLVKPDAKLTWKFLDNTVGEANGCVTAAERKNFTATRLDGDKATSDAILSALPKAKVAHFATHGFFADASFRSVFQLDPKDYEQSWRGERIGRAANSPLVMTGLVFAGANNPKTPGRGIVTGEALIDLDLGGLELAVLSACETGLGDVAGGEGTFGLQRAFHYAGTTNVVASLWKVPDASTAALMALFYRNLWTQNLSPVESLRRAQLELYKNPDKIPELAKGFRGKFVEVPGANNVALKPGQDGKAHPLLWAAFTLSGPGR